MAARRGRRDETIASLLADILSDALTREVRDRQGRTYSPGVFALTPEARHQVWGTGGIEREARGLPAFNFYRDHAAGQGSYHVGLRMPWPAAGPYVLYGGPTKYSHLARADRFSLVWLEEQGYEVGPKLLAQSFGVSEEEDRKSVV